MITQYSEDTPISPIIYTQNSDSDLPINFFCRLIL